jgi:hypothetical protein
MLHFAYPDNPALADVRDAARSCLITWRVLTAKELGALTQEAALATALQRLKAMGWTDPTAIAG